MKKKNPPAMRETWVQSLGWEDPLEKERLSTPVFWPGEFHGLCSLWVTMSWTQLSDLHFHFQFQDVILDVFMYVYIMKYHIMKYHHNQVN